MNIQFGGNRPSRSSSILIGPQDSSKIAEILEPIDTDKIAAKLELEWKGAEDGRQNIPPADAETLSATENQVVQLAQSEWWLFHGGAFLNELRAYASRLAGFSVAAEFEQLSLKGKDALAKLRRAHHAAEEELAHSYKAFVEASRELASFRRKNRLDRPARNQSGRWTTIGLLFFLTAFEAMLNGVYFAKGSELGWVGGIGTAIGISLANVLFAFLLGLGPGHWLNSRNLLLKLAGAAIVTAGAAFLIFLHAFAAHFRDATAAVGEAEAMANAIGSLFLHPLRLAEISSFYLFGLGVLFAIAALWKGYASDDPYPGYGAQFRRFKSAREDYADQHSELFDGLDDIKDDVVEQLEGGINRLPHFPQQAQRIRNARDGLVETFRLYESTLAGAANDLLTRYRQANRLTRTVEVPKHFSESWKLPYSLLDHNSLGSLLSDTRDTDVEVPVALNNLKQMAEQILEEYEKLIKKFPHTSQLLGDPDVATETPTKERG